MSRILDRILRFLRLRRDPPPRVGKVVKMAADLTAKFGGGS